MQAFLDKVFKYGIAATLIAIPLYPKFPLFYLPGSSVSIRLEDFLILVLFFLYIWKILVASGRELAKNLKARFVDDKINLTILLFLLAGLVSLISSILITQTVVPAVGFLHWARRIEYIVPFFIAIEARLGGGDLSFYVKVLILTVFIVFLYGFLQRYFGFPIVTTQNYEYSKGAALRYTPGAHIPGTFAGHYDLASFVVFISPLIFLLFFNVREKFYKIAFGVSILFLFWLLTAAISRISMISLLLGVVLSLAIFKKFKEILLVFAVWLAVIGFSSDLLVRYGRVIKATFENLVSSYEPIKPAFAQSATHSVRRRSTIKEEEKPPSVFEDRSTSIRLNVEWPRAIRAFAKNPILGTGFSSITLATDSDYLRLLGEIGILGFCAFLLVIARILKTLGNFLSTSKEQSLERIFVVAVFAGTVAILINAIFIDIFEASKFAIIFWLTSGIAVNLVRRKDNDDKIIS